MKNRVKILQENMELIQFPKEIDWNAECVETEVNQDLVDKNKENIQQTMDEHMVQTSSAKRL